MRIKREDYRVCEFRRVQDYDYLQQTADENKNPTELQHSTGTLWSNQIVNKDKK